MRVGSRDYWRNWISSYGLETRPRFQIKAASAEAEDRLPGRAAAAEAAGGRALPTHIGAESGESGCAPTAVASASAGSDADPGS